METLIKNFKIPRKISWKRVFALGISVLVFSYLFYRAYHGVKEIITNGIHFEIGYLLLSFSCQMIGVALAIFIWGNIVHRLHVESTYIFDAEAFCASALGKKIPGTVWYAVGRIFLYNFKYKASKTIVMIAVLIEAIMLSLGGLVALVISVVTGFGQIAWLKQPSILVIIIITILLITSLVGPRIIHFFIRRTYKKQESLENIEIPNINARDTLRWLIGETLLAFLASAMGYFLLKSMNSDVFVPFTSVAGALSMAIALGPITMWLPGDIGLKDGFLYLVLSSYLGGPFAAVVTLTWRIWGTLLELLLGGLSLIALNRDLKLLKNQPDIYNGVNELDRN